MQKALIFLGAILFASAVHAQTPDGSNNRTDTTHRYGMHRAWGHRDGNDSMHRRDGWQRDSRNAGGRDGFTRNGDRRPHIRFSPEQRQQMQAVNKDYHRKSTDLFKNDNQTLREYKAGLIALQKDRKSKIQALITPEQKEQMEKWKKNRAENTQVMAAARMERLKIRLGLSDQQLATLKSKEADLRAQRQSLHENDGLLPQQKMEQFREMRTKQKEIVKSVLTPDQLSKFNEMEMAHHSHHDDQGK
jgi:hypothetical protein